MFFSIASTFVAAAAFAVAAPAPAGMATVPAGRYAPLYGTSVHVAAFALDKLPVTRGDFLSFVKQHREWRRSIVGPANADRSYLADWTSDLDAGADLRRPVTNVSLRAAAAYCAAQAKRLPTTAEWERAAAASETRADASRDAAFSRELMSLYSARASAQGRAVGGGERNVFGIRDLHGLVWEWTSDFNRSATHDHAGHDSSAHTGTATCASAAIGATTTDNYPAFLRYAVRAGLERTSTTQTLGFRCAL